MVFLFIIIFIVNTFTLIYQLLFYQELILMVYTTLFKYQH